MTSKVWLRAAASGVALFVGGAGLMQGAGASGTSGATPKPTSTAVTSTSCDAGSKPETGVQGQVPRADRTSGRSTRGYSCNMHLVGQWQGQGATWVQPSYGHCTYIGSFFPGTQQAQHKGVQVLDVSDPAHPRFVTSLNSAAMALGTWETLKVDPVHGYLAASGTPLSPGVGGLTFDLYDIKTDCAHPRLLNRNAGALPVPMTVLSHEAAFSPDGRTFYEMSSTGFVTAIDVTTPSRPRVIYVGNVGASNHGVSFSPDGRTMYGVTAIPAGLQILDVSSIQHRSAHPRITQIGSLSWSDGLFSQHTINFTSHGHPYLYAVDEAGGGGVRLIDIKDPARPVLVREYRLAINRTANQAKASADTGGDGVFGYDAHYCSLDRRTDPTMLACSYFQSGVRLMDVTKPLAPRELGYYNPPAQVGRQGRLVNSAHAQAYLAPDVLDPEVLLKGTSLLDSSKPNMNTDWCSSPPKFKPGHRLWVTCQDNGFLVLHYTKTPA